MCHADNVPTAINRISAAPAGGISGQLPHRAVRRPQARLPVALSDDNAGAIDGVSGGGRTQILQPAFRMAHPGEAKPRQCEADERRINRRTIPYERSWQS